tara:strand:+ start:5391 stop:7544 length:2154 start_codon:yes stop_codon:yes gene_type:complete
MISYRYIKNLRDNAAHKTHDVSVIQKVKPKFANKADFRTWCAAKTTDHVFYSLVEGDAPAERISGHNPPNIIHGVVADYDAPVKWANVDADIAMSCGALLPTWRSKTQSGYIRLVWEFEEGMPISPQLFDAFMGNMKQTLKLSKVLAGFDSSSLKAAQYFELGEDWVKMSTPLDSSVVQTALLKAASSKAPQTTDTSIPIEVIAAEVENRFPNRWMGEFEVGLRGPLFWIDDGIDREGCQISEDGMICYSDRAGKGFLSWREIFGPSFVEDYEQQKMGNLLDEYWFNGKTFFKLLQNTAVQIPREQLILELRQFGFSTRLKKGQTLSEVEAAMLVISNQNRITEIAPVIFSNDRIVECNGNRILNTSTIEPVAPAADGDPKNWPFLHQWLHQLFENSTPQPTIDYFFAWLKRFYIAVVDKHAYQGQALILVGPTGRGKSLLSNRVISGLVGGFSDASDYLSGHTKFNKDLGRVAAWVIDDTTSASSFQDQRKATELIKRAVANPRIEYMAKYADSISIPWSGRVILSLNMDANSLSVIPSLDSSNRDKLMAIRVRDGATSDFPPNVTLEKTIQEELPYLGKWLLDWNPPQEVEDFGRFGVVSFIDESVASAAYDNSSRSAVAELVEIFSKRCRDIDPHKVTWEGTLTEFQVTLHDMNNGRSVGMSNNLEFVRRGMSTLEEAGKANVRIRPVASQGKGGGKVWSINVEERFDISKSSP